MRTYIFQILSPSLLEYIIMENEAIEAIAKFRMLEIRRNVRNHFEEKVMKNPNGKDGALYAGFSKFLTSKEFKILLKKLHQVRGRPRRPLRLCRRLCKKGAEKKYTQQMEMNTFLQLLPLSQPCWCLDFTACKQLGDDAMLHLHLIPSTVIDLDFSCCNLTPVGVKRLCDYLKGSGGSNIERMILYGNQIGNDGAMFLADMLKANTTLKILSIRENRKKSETAAIFSEILGDDEESITEDDTSSEEEEEEENSRITYSGWRALSDAIAENSTLRFFDFANSSFENRDLLALVPGLRKNKGLRTLDLRLSKITDYGVRRILQHLILKYHNKTMREIHLPEESWFSCTTNNDDPDPITRETTQELEYALRRNYLLHREEAAKEEMQEDDTPTTKSPPTDKNWLNLLEFTATNKNPTCSFWLLRNDKPNLCNLAHRGR